ncbi:hypothetical protein [Rubinisphaera margarita]|uniref:hypothetical protein n=1 Tax=Rubinisphaera margarita TaxID=2909586 RepID=UPI001EE90E73|nr:hypothetical protein [Rubinisphaera margarita]MCG6156635.1 hypothetical protein [Rubinisphaera margarita]
MTQQENNGFEDAPNMVAGEVESAQQIDRSAASSKRSQMTKLLFAVALLLFAGGWAYSNQNDFKAALGMKTDKQFPGCTAGGSCCSHAVSVAEGGTGVCCHEEKLAAEAAEEACCANLQKSAMAAALLKGTESTSDELAEIAPNPPSAEDIEAAKIEAAEEELTEEPAEAAAEQVVEETTEPAAT